MRACRSRSYTRSCATACSACGWGFAKAGIDSLARRVWQDGLASRSLSSAELSEVTACCTLSVAKLRAAVGELVALSGMTALQPDGDLARAWRDLQVLAAHVSVSPRHLMTAGATLLAASDLPAR